MNEKYKNSFWVHLGIVLALCLLLYVLFFASLKCVTKHGKEIQIPGVTNKDVATAVTLLKDMHFEVIVDSTYEPAMKALTILRQVPDSGSIVKEGRTIYLTVNMLNPPSVPMPNLVNLSYRSAEMLLRNNKLLVGDTVYKSDIAAGAVLEQNFKQIAQGSKVNMVIGNGLGNTEWPVPNVTGMTVDEAMTVLNQFNLQPIIVSGDQGSAINDTLTAYIIDQQPRELNDAGEHNRIKMGAFIDLQVKQTPSPEDYHQSNNTIAPDAVNDNNPKNSK
jgi:beta-lactam-binding protein with PASTA domain